MTDKVRQLLEQVADELRKHQNEDATNLIDRIDEIISLEEALAPGAFEFRKSMEPSVSLTVTPEVGRPTLESKPTSVGETPPMLVEFIPEFIDKLREQLEADQKRWGNNWLNRPKEGQELRTKARYTDYFDQFKEAGSPMPWMKVIGGALICWIRDQHPELFLNHELHSSPACLADEKQRREESDKPQDANITKSSLIYNPKIDTSELEESIADEVVGVKVSEGGVEDISMPVISSETPVPAEQVEEKLGFLVMKEKPVEDMTTKELIESEPIIRHKSDCAVHNEPAMPAGECDCQDRDLSEE